MTQYSYLLLVINTKQYAHRREYCQTDCMHSLVHPLYDTVSPIYYENEKHLLKKCHQSKIKQTHI